MKKIQWISAVEYERQLAAKLWRKVFWAFVVCLAPLLLDFSPMIVTLLLLGLLSKRLSMAMVNTKIATFSVLVILPVGVFSLFTGFRQLGVSHSFLAFLAVMSVCKLLEAKNLRDTRVLFLVDMVLMLSFLMFHQSMGIFVYLLFAIGVVFYVQLKISQRSSRIVSLGSWWAVVKLLALAFPFAIAVFFTFPRLSPIWGLPRHSNEMITGLPNEMNMEGLSKLAESDEISFRVKFEDNKVPSGELLYWRGPVLWYFTGSRWQQRDADFYQSQEDLRYLPESEIHYTLTTAKPDLEWIPALEMINNISGNYQMGSAHQIHMGEENKGEQRFEITSATIYRLNSLYLSNKDRQLATQLPATLDLPKTQALASQLYQAGGKTTEGFAQEFMNYLRNNEFYYSLEPMSGASEVENFLFPENGSFGFCQHYANAMAIAARSIGLPSRVIMGYQGGVYNAISENFVVREENAHAWVELWVENKGWLRFDPTAAVAPFRIQNSTLNSDTLTGEDRRSAVSRYAEKFDTILWLRDVMDATQSFWQNWVIHLNNDRQGSLLGILSWLGIGAKLMLGLVMLATIVLLWFVWQWWEKRPRQDEDEIARAAYKALNRLSKRGMVKPNQETFSDFLRRIADVRKPENAEDFYRIADNYEKVRYRNQVIEGDLTIQLRKIKYR